MTKLQEVLFALLKETVRVCDELNIDFFLVCGTALGAVKYQGFIPWDDDCDIAMTRENYEHFIENAPKMLSDGLFLQNYHSESPCPRIYSKLRDSRTTYIEKQVASLDINHGVYIDIFPLDEYPSGRLAQKILEIKKTVLYRRATTIYAQKRTGLSEILRRWNLLRHYDKKTNLCVAKLEKALIVTNGKKAGVLCNHGNWQGRLEYAPYEQYGDGAWTTFEGLRVRVPQNYNEYLTQKYGDWRAELPKEQQIGHHYYEICDLNRPYTDYIERLPNGKIRVKEADF